MQQLIEFASANPILVSAFLILLFLLLKSYIGSASVKNLSNMEAIRLMNNGNAWALDVRTEEEFEKSHIVNAINIPLGTLDAKISSIENSKSDPVIIICQSGNRSAQAAKVLKKHAFEDINHLAGGMLNWSQANLPVESGANKKTGKQDKTARKKKGKQNSQPSMPANNAGNISHSKEDAGSDEGANDSPEPDKALDKIIVYTAGYCPFTTKVKKLLDQKGINFQQVNVDNDPGMRKLVMSRSNQATFPQVFVGEKHVGNCDELHQLEQDGQLDNILGLKHA